MEFRLESHGREINFSADKSGEDELCAQVGERNIKVRVARISDFELFLTITENDKTVNKRVFVADTPEGKWVAAGGLSRFYRDQDLVKTRRGKKKGLAGGPSVITPPMPAAVVRIPVAVGDEVAAGDPVIVVSAMKMETTLSASYAGVVEKVNVAVGDKVMPGDILVDIAPAEGEAAAE